jgi:hypothetical protein
MAKNIAPVKLDEKEREILNALYKIHKRNPSLYLDLAVALHSWDQTEVERIVQRLHNERLLFFLPSQDNAHFLCRITPSGVDVLFRTDPSIRNFQSGKKAILLVILAILAIGVYSIKTIQSPDKTSADITGPDITKEAKEILMEWIEEREEEDSDHYTFALLETIGDRKTYLVECRMEYIDECKYNIIFVELDEATGEITNVELAEE